MTAFEGPATLAYPIVLAEEFPHGLTCMCCARAIEAGQPYRDQLDSMLDDHDSTPVEGLYCVYC